MAVINCPECKKEISDQAEKCIGCGYPINKNNQSSGKMYIENNKIGKDLMLGGGILFVAFAAMAYYIYSTSKPEQYMIGYSILSFVGLVMYIVGRIKHWYHSK